MAFLSFSAASTSLLSYAIIRESDGLRWRFAGAGSPGFVAYASGSASDFAATMPQAAEGLNRFVVASPPAGFVAGVAAGTLCIIYVYARAGATITNAELGAKELGAVEAVWDGSAFVPVAPYLLATVLADTDNIQTRLPAALVGGRMDSSVGAMAEGTITAGAIATGAIDADSLASDAVAEIADGVWDEALSGHATAGSAGKAMSEATGLSSDQDALIARIAAVVGVGLDPGPDTGWTETRTGNTIIRRHPIPGGGTLVHTINLSSSGKSVSVSYES